MPPAIREGSGDHGAAQYEPALQPFFPGEKDHCPGMRTIVVVMSA